MARHTASPTAKRKKPSKKNGDDAISLLKADHREVERLFEEFESADDDSEKRDLSDRICAALTQHAAIEETIFYPAAREALGEDGADMLDEATVEHGSLKELIAQIEGGEDDDLFEARIKVLSEYVKHHVKEEEKEMMPEVKRTGLDLDAVGARIKAEKEGATSSRAHDTGDHTGRETSP